MSNLILLMMNVYDSISKVNQNLADEYLAVADDGDYSNLLIVNDRYLAKAGLK